MIFAVLLLGSCATDCGSGAPCDATAGAPAATSERSARTDNPEADVAVARFMNDPTNPDSWPWLCLAAARGNTAAQYTVAVRYRDGLPPVERNTTRAYRWFTAAIRNGLSAAALARSDMQKSIPDRTLAELRREKRAANKSDCAEAAT